MKLNRLHVDGFGVLEEDNFGFGGGLNVVYGPNEAGKSTLQRAILTLLYGFYCRERVSPEEKQAHARYRPWSSAPFGGTLQLTVDSGEQYLLTRKFDTPEPESHIYEAQTGNEITERFVRRRRGFIDFADRQLGMARNVFEAIACIEQGRLTDLREGDAGDIGDAILRLVDSAEAAVSVKNALDRLAAGIRTLGTDRSKSGPIARARQALAEGEAMQQQHAKLAESLDAEYAKVSDLAETVARLGDQERALRTELDSCRLADLKERLDRLLEIKDRKAEIRKALGADVHAAEVTMADRDRIVKMAQELKFLRGGQQELYDEMAANEEARAAARDALDRIPVDAAFWTENQDQQFYDARRTWLQHQENLRRSQSEEAGLRADLESAGIDAAISPRLQQLDSGTIENLRKLDQAVKDQQETLKSHGEGLQRRRNVALVTRYASAAGLLACTILALLTPVDAAEPGPINWRSIFGYAASGIAVIWFTIEFLMGAAIRGLTAERSRAAQRRQVLKEELREGLAEFGATSFPQLLTFKLKYAEIQQQGADTSAQMREVDAAAARLQKWMARFDLPTVSQDTVNRASEILDHGRHQWEHIQKLNTRVHEIGGELARKEERISLLIEAMQERLEAVSGWTGQLETDIDAYLRHAEASVARDTAERELLQLDRREEELLAGREHKTIDTEVRRLESLGIRPAPKQDLAQVQRLESECNHLRSDLQKKQVELATLRERIAQQESRLPHISEIEERMAASRAELESLNLKRQALELAFETLGDVSREVHRDFAPKLAAMVGKNLGQMTDGRYQEVYIDPADFTVRVAHGRARTLVPLSSLSFGTQEMTYLMMRASIARTFSASSELVPLLLDDPLAHADARRRKETLNYIAKLAESQQVLYFTKDPGVLEDLEALGVDFRRVEMRGRHRSRVPHRWAAGTARRSER